MATYTPPPTPTPTETRIVIEMTEDEARGIFNPTGRSASYCGVLFDTIENALDSPAVRAKPAREPDEVIIHRYLMTYPKEAFTVAHFGHVRARSDSLEIDFQLVAIEFRLDECVLAVDKVRAMAHDMLAACDWAERQAAEREMTADHGSTDQRINSTCP